MHSNHNEVDDLIFSSLGADITCESNSMTVLIDRVLLASGDGASDVSLVDDSCLGYDHDSVRVAVSTSFDDCGTTMEVS